MSRDSRAHGFTALSWVAIAAFAVLGVAALCVLWPAVIAFVAEVAIWLVELAMGG